MVKEMTTLVLRWNISFSFGFSGCDNLGGIIRLLQNVELIKNLHRYRSVASLGRKIYYNNSYLIHKINRKLSQEGRELFDKRGVLSAEVTNRG